MLMRARLNAERERAEIAEAAARDLAHRRDLLEVVVAVSNQLLGASSLDDAAQSTCERIGTAFKADRFGIGKFLPPDAHSELGYWELLHEWNAPGIPRQMEDPDLAKLNVDEYREFHARLSNRQHLAILSTELENEKSRRDQAKLSLSQFIYPIFVDDHLWGGVGADDCKSPRIWDEGEIATLSLVASAISSTVKREMLTQARIDAERALFEDRSRIAREIHDTLAQGFTGVIMQTQAAAEALSKKDSAAVFNHLGRTQAIASSSLKDARRSVFALLPSVLHGRTLAAALHEQLQTMASDVQLTVEFSEHGTAKTASNLIAAEFIRIAQEATSNALRHASATTLHVSLAWEGDMVTLAISDDGVGFDPSQQQAGFGLVSIRERASRMGAELVIKSVIAGLIQADVDGVVVQGTRIAVTANSAQDYAIGKTQ
jgi:signal transduction histidine kinase